MGKPIPIRSFGLDTLKLRVHWWGKMYQAYYNVLKGPCIVPVVSVFGMLVSAFEDHMGQNDRSINN